MKNKLIIAFSYLLTLVAILIILLKLFYPNHRLIAFTTYAISWILLIYGIIKFKRIQRFVKKNKHILSIIKKYKYYILNAIFLIFIGYLLVILFPVSKWDYFQIEKTELRQKLDTDIENIQIYKAGQEKILDLFKENKNIIEKEFNDLTIEDRDLLLSLWSSYLIYAKELDTLNQTHKYFYQISYLDEPELNSKSFLVAYLSLLINYKTFLAIDTLVDDSQHIKTIFNEEILELNMQKNSYLELSKNFVNVNNLIRINAGYANTLFLEKFRKNITKDEEIMISSSKNIYQKVTDTLDSSAELFTETPLDFFEQSTFQTWFPAQKEIAEGIGDITLGLRDKYITEENLDELKVKLKPGDVFLQRREWELSNVGIPGFWTHSAIYIGNPDDLALQFSDIISAKELKNKIKESNPEFYKYYYKKENPAVLEANKHGVVLKTLYESATADYLGVLRVKTSKEDQLQSILVAIKYYGRPYDFNFDFVTDNEILCSELIFKAYQIKNDSNGVPFQLELSSGRHMLSPNNIVKQYDQQLKNQYLEFVAYLNYDGEKIIFDSEENFSKSWERPMSESFIQEATALISKLKY